MNWAIDKKSYSQRRACDLIGIDRRVYRYRSRRPDYAIVRKRWPPEHRRFGCRRLNILLQSEGFHLNWKNFYRRYREERLMVCKRGGCNSARAPLVIPQGASSRWNLDFVSGALLDSRRLSILCVPVDFTRKCLAAVVDNSLSSIRVTGELGQPCKTRGH